MRCPLLLHPLFSWRWVSGRLNYFPQVTYLPSSKLRFKPRQSGIRVQALNPYSELPQNWSHIFFNTIQWLVNLKQYIKCSSLISVNIFYLICVEQLMSLLSNVFLILLEPIRRYRTYNSDVFSTSSESPSIISSESDFRQGERHLNK